MMLELDLNCDHWQQFVDSVPDQSYTVVEQYWEDSDEWCIVEITDPKWQTWAALCFSDLVVDGS